MTRSIVIFADIDKCVQLFDVFNEKSVMLSEAILIPPISEKITSEETELLNAKKNMSRWLMPFGFIAGIAFSNMTNLSTFSFLGLNNIGAVSYTHLTLPTILLV